MRAAHPLPLSVDTSSTLAAAQGPETIVGWQRWSRFALPLGIVAAVGVVDYLASTEIQFALFYLIAVALAAWTVGRGFGVLVSVLSLCAWLLGDLAGGVAHPRPFVMMWNAAIVLGFYLVVVALLGRVRDMNHELERRVAQRTIALTEEMAERQRLEREMLDVGERERRRIGRDLHDSLGQLLTGTALAGQVLHERLAARELDEAGDASRVVGLVEEAIELTRSLSRGLDPVEMAGGGLDEGLRELAMTTSAHPNVRCEYYCPCAISTGSSPRDRLRVSSIASSTRPPPDTSIASRRKRSATPSATAAPRTSRCAWSRWARGCGSWSTTTAADCRRPAAAVPAWDCASWRTARP